MNDDDLRRALDGLVSPLPPLGALPPGVAARVRRRRAAKLAGTGALAVVLLVGGAALALPGAGGDRLVPQPRASAAPTAPPTALPSPVPSAEPSCEVECGEQLRVTLEPDGLSVLTLPGGTARTLLFEQATGAEVREVLGAALGDAVERALPDCSPTAVLVTFGDAVTVVLEDDVLQGWSVDERGPRLTTAEGIAVGSTLADLRAAYPDVQVSESTLGPEFSVEGGVSGFLRDDLVTGVNAGFTCVFR